MGLDVSVYQNIKETDNESDADFTAFVIDENWKWKIKNLKDGANYTGDCVDNSISYAYSSHSQFRAMLLQLIGRTDLLKPDGRVNYELITDDVPFFAFIDFADNEGCLDFEVSEKIYADFAEWNGKAQQTLNGFDLRRYNEWMNAFDLARKNGVVVFG